MPYALSMPLRVTSIEVDPKNARLARQAFKETGVGDRTEVREGSARDILPTLTEKFDAVFVDADKESYPFYFGHVTVRPAASAI